MAVPQQLDEVKDAISRCARAAGDAGRLRTELSGLARSPDPRARLALALFELELARRGEDQARAGLPAACEVLLEVWRAGSGETLAGGHPTTGALWVRASTLLTAFEDARFEAALATCWTARQDRGALATAIARLLPDGQRRAEFSRCLYHLELARQGVDASRAEFARRAGLVAEAYQDPAVARELVGADEGLAFLWQELVPYLDEFFETLEEQAEARAAAEAARRAPEDAPAPRATLPEPRRVPGAATAPALGAEPRTVPSFRSLIGGAPGDATPPAPPPPAFTPSPIPGPAAEDEELILEGEELEEAQEAPPPPPVSSSVSPVPARPGRRTRPPAGAPLGAAASAFWQHTFTSLDLLPGESGRSARAMACETRAERKRLSEFVDSLAPHLQVPEARAMACLVSLMLAGQTKEKNLFGQPNPRRADSLLVALPYLSADPGAAGRVAVWFELDGPLTQQALAVGLDLLARYLASCAQQRQDPLSPASVEAFVRG